MAHEIDFSTDAPAIAFIGETPWHKFGEKLDTGQPIEAWLKAARLEWELKRLPVQYLVNARLTNDGRKVWALARTPIYDTVDGDGEDTSPR